jgi:cytoskeletal protein RodZ
MQLVQSLAVGERYHIKGREYTIGDKTVINDPVAVKADGKRNRKRRFLILGTAMLLASAVAGGGLYLSSRSAAAMNAADQGSPAITKLPSARTAAAASKPAAAAEKTDPKSTPVSAPTPSPAASVRTAPARSGQAVTPASVPPVQPVVPSPPAAVQPVAPAPVTPVAPPVREPVVAEPDSESLVPAPNDTPEAGSNPIVTSPET